MNLDSFGIVRPNKEIPVFEVTKPGWNVKSSLVIFNTGKQSKFKNVVC